MYIHNRHFIIIKVVMSDYDNIKVCCNYNL